MTSSGESAESEPGNGARTLAVSGAVFFVIAGAVLMAGLVSMATIQVAPITRHGVVIAALAALFAGGAGLTCMGLALLTWIPYHVVFGADSLTLIFPFRRHEVGYDQLMSYRYLFVLGGRFGAPGDLVVAKVTYALPHEADTVSSLLLLLGHETAPAFISPQAFSTELDVRSPEKRLGKRAQ